MGDIDVDFFLGTLKNLIADSKNNYIKDKKHQLESLVEDITYLREFLKRTEKKRNEHLEVMNLVVRIRDVVSETENIVEVFVTRVYKADRSGQHDYLSCQDDYISLDFGSLQDFVCEALSVRSDQDDISYHSDQDHISVQDDISTHSDQDDLSLDIESVKKDIMTLKVEVERILDKDVYDINGVAVIKRKHSSTTSKGGPSSSGGRDTYKVGEEREVVGFKDEVTKLMGKLHDFGDRRNLEIISIIGAGGVGKTTLAREVYDHPLTLQKFEIRAWVNVSQGYNKTMKRDLLMSILKSAFPKDHEDYKEIDEDDEDHEELVDFPFNPKKKKKDVGEKVYNCLKEKKYLVVLDDIWGLEAWNDIQRSFPREFNESKVMLTSRQCVQPDSVDCIPHFIDPLPDSRSWELLQKKVFKKGQCPPELEDIGMQIAKKCEGLPLAIIATAGILATEDKTIDMWEKVAEHLRSIIAKRQEGTMEILELSYNHLPLHLKACFLFMGAHQEDYEIPVRKLIWLWIAEGFIHQTDGEKSLEAIAKDHLNDLVERNIIIVVRKDRVGTIKACRMHDLLCELCLKKGKEDNFFVQFYKDDSSPYVKDEDRRLFIGNQLVDNICYGFHYPSFTNGASLRSFLCPTFRSCSRYDVRKLSFFAERFKLLRVLHIENSYTIYYGRSELRKGDLVHLRYLALLLGKTLERHSLIWQDFFYLSNLEILELDFVGGMLVPPEVLKMVRLRNLYSKEGNYMFHHNYEDEGKENMLESLQILHGICSCERCLHFLKRAPNLRKLRIEEIVTPTVDLFLYDLEFLKCLEILHFRGSAWRSSIGTVELKLPPNITRLALSDVRLTWEQLSILLQTLPRLEVLKLSRNPNMGRFWNISELEEGFSELKYLKLSQLAINEWSASEYHFPKLEVLVIHSCWLLKGIPIEFANLYEIREIEVRYSTKSAEQSAQKIQEEQKNMKGEDACLNLVAGSNLYPDGFSDDY